jgi:hypothetical protein
VHALWGGPVAEDGPDHLMGSHARAVFRSPRAVMLWPRTGGDDPNEQLGCSPLGQMAHTRSSTRPTRGSGRTKAGGHWEAAGNPQGLQASVKWALSLRPRPLKLRRCLLRRG